MSQSQPRRRGSGSSEASETQLVPMGPGPGGGDEAASVGTALVQSRQAQEVQAAMIVARQFPRDHALSLARISTACTRVALAEAAQYGYKRGDTIVTGPSIRLAEALAQSWGNLDYGIVELEQRAGTSTVMAYCWDLETNTRQTKVFTVPHVRFTKRGAYPLTDSRDIYELVANQGARRLRACILGVIPGDVQDAAITKCRETMAKNAPLEVQIDKALKAFAQLGISKSQIEARLGHHAAAIVEGELHQLRGIHRSISDGVSAPGDWFSFDDRTERKGPSEAGGKSPGDALADDLAAKSQGESMSGDDWADFPPQGAE